MPFLLVIAGGKQPRPTTCRFGGFPAQPNLVHFLQWIVGRAFDAYADIDGVGQELFGTTIQCLDDTIRSRRFLVDAPEQRVRVLCGPGLQSIRALNELLLPAPELRGMLSGDRHRLSDRLVKLDSELAPGSAAWQVATVVFSLGWLAATDAVGVGQLFTEDAARVGG